MAIQKNNYYFMHKDVIVGVLTVLPETNALVKWEVLNRDHAPLGHEETKSFSSWLDRRAIPNHQKNTSNLLGGKNGFAYMLENLSISLIDNYWLKPLESDLKWKDINLYQNDFQEIDFHFETISNMSPFKPSATTQGELQKRWAIRNGERFLVKGNYGDMYRQSINEVFASMLHEMQGKPHVHYDLINLPTELGDGIGCICQNFTSENLEFIPAYDVSCYGKQPNSVSALQYYQDVAVRFGIEKQTMQDFLDYQILSDFLLTNTDRHLLNLGILRDATTLKFISPAPIFDTGNSMFYNGHYSKDNVLNIPVTSFYKTEVKMMEQVVNRNILDLNKIPSVSEIKKLYEADPYSAVYLSNMTDGYEKKIEIIDAFQRGLSLNPRNPMFYEKHIKEKAVKKELYTSFLSSRSDGEPYKNDPEEYRKQTKTPFSPRFTIEKWKTETDADKLYTAVLCSNGHINYGRGLEILKAIMENENTPEDALIMVAGGKLDNQGKSMMTNADVISTWEHILNNKNCPAGLAADILLETVMNQNKIEPELAQRILDKAHELLKSKGYSDIAGVTASFQKGDTSNENLLIAVSNIMEKRLPTLLHKSVEDSPNAPGGDMIEESLGQDNQECR